MREILPPVREHQELDLPLARLLGNDGTLDLYPEVVNHDYFRIRLNKRTITFKAGGYVGIIPLNDRIAINVQPRVDVRRLSRLLSITERTPVALDMLLRGYGIAPERVASLTDLVANAFVAAARDASRFGLPLEYQEREDDTSFPRGRIEMRGTLAHRARGATHLVRARWFTLTVDTAMNRVIKLATLRLCAYYQASQRRAGHRRLLTELDQLLRTMTSVSLISETEALRNLELRSPAISGEEHRPLTSAVVLAEWIIRGQGPEVGEQGAPAILSSILLKMDDVFEAYVRRVLVSGLSDLAVLDGNLSPPSGASRCLFADATTHQATPDIVVIRAPRSPIVVEVKYKLESDRDDLNQIIAYAASYGASHAVLLTLGSEPFSGVLGTIGTMHIASFKFHLEGELEDEEVRLCSFIRRLADRQIIAATRDL